MIEQSVELKFWNYSNEIEILKKIEEIGRNAYQSFSYQNEDSCFKFIKMIISKNHFGLLEHESATFKIVTNRAIANELTRHRLGSYVQESTRYVNYKKHKPEIIVDKSIADYVKNVDFFEQYLKLLNNKIKPEIARDFLPLALKTTIYATMNLRSWFHFLKLRLASDAHPMMRDIAGKIYILFKEKIPFITNEMTINYLKKRCQNLKD